MDAAFVEIVWHAVACCMILHQFHVGVGVFGAVEIVGGLRTEGVAAIQVVTGSTVFPWSSTV